MKKLIFTCAVAIGAIVAVNCFAGADEVKAAPTCNYIYASCLAQSGRWSLEGAECVTPSSTGNCCYEVCTRIP